MVEKIYDVIIIGGGPAGLNAAIVLGRCRRQILLFDTGQQRNRHSQGIHNFITRDNMMPAEFLQCAAKEIIKYGIETSADEILEVQRFDNLFQVRDKQHRTFTSKKLLIATGLRDHLPQLPGIESYYGRSVFHCPYCDGWEVTDKKIGVYARDKNGFELCLSLKSWTNDIQLYSDGNNYLKRSEKATLERLQIKVITDKIVSIEGTDGQIKCMVFENGSKSPCDALFFLNGYEQQCNLVKSLGCIISSKGTVVNNRKQQTNIPGLFVAGDASRDVQFVIVAAAEGAKAGVCINKELQKEAMEALQRKVADT